MRGSKNRSTKDGRHRKLLEDHIQGVARQRATNPQRRSCYVMCTLMGAARVVRLVDGSPELRWQVPCRTCQGAVSVSAGDENQEQTRPGAGRPGDKKRGRVRDRPAGETGDADMVDGGRRRGADQSSRSRSPVQYAWTTAYANTPCPECRNPLAACVSDTDEWVCDECGQDLAIRTVVLGCRDCNYDICRACTRLGEGKKHGPNAVSPQPPQTAARNAEPQNSAHNTDHGRGSGGNDETAHDAVPGGGSGDGPILGRGGSRPPPMADGVSSSLHKHQAWQRALQQRLRYQQLEQQRREQRRQAEAEQRQQRQASARDQDDARRRQADFEARRQDALRQEEQRRQQEERQEKFRQEKERERQAEHARMCRDAEERKRGEQQEEARRRRQREQQQEKPQEQERAQEQQSRRSSRSGRGRAYAHAQAGDQSRSGRTARPRGAERADAPPPPRPPRPTRTRGQTAPMSLDEHGLPTPPPRGASQEQVRELLERWAANRGLPEILNAANASLGHGQEAWIARNCKVHSTVRAAYRKAALGLHPDKWTQVAPARAEEKARAGELFKLISKAWMAFAGRNPDPGRRAKRATATAPVTTAEQTHADAMQMD